MKVGEDIHIPPVDNAKVGEDVGIITIVGPPNVMHQLLTVLKSQRSC